MRIEEWKKIFVSIYILTVILILTPLLIKNISITTEKFLSLGILGQNNQIEQYFPRNNPVIQINQNMNWSIYISNNYNEVKYLSIYVKLLNETSKAPNTIDSSPSISPIIYSRELIVLNGQEILLPFNWSLLKYEIEGEDIILNDLIINNDLISDLDIKGNRFRLIFELWVFDENNKEFKFNWYNENNINHCSWNQAATVLLERGLEVQQTEDDDRESVQRASAAFDELVGWA